MLMLAMSFFSWWYGRGWKEVLDSFGPRLSTMAAMFSVVQLLRTLFSPWRRIITYPGTSFPERVRAWGDNAFSRVIGFVVRLFVLLAAAIALLTVAIITILELVIWPLLPLAIPGGLVAGALL